MEILTDRAGKLLSSRSGKSRHLSVEVRKIASTEALLLFYVYLFNIMYGSIVVNAVVQDYKYVSI